MDMNVVDVSRNYWRCKKKEDHSGQIWIWITTPNCYNANALGEIKTLNYAMLQSPYNTLFQMMRLSKELKFTLTGNMNRYVWSMDNKILSKLTKYL